MDFVNSLSAVILASRGKASEGGSGGKGQGVGPVGEGEAFEHDETWWALEIDFLANNAEPLLLPPTSTVASVPRAHMFAATIMR